MTQVVVISPACRETYEKEANELHSEAALQDLNGQTDAGTNACINDKLRPTLEAYTILHVRF